MAKLKPCCTTQYRSGYIRLGAVGFGVSVELRGTCGAQRGNYVLNPRHQAEVHRPTAAFLFLGREAAAQAFLHLQQEGFFN